MAVNTELKTLVSLIKYAKGMKQETIADAVGVKPTYLSDMINGRVPFSANFKEKLYEVFSDCLNADTPPTPSAPTVQTPKETRPHLPVTAAAGTLGGISEGIMPRDCEQLPKMPNTPDYDFTITVSGNSMEPEFRNGDIIAAKRVCSMIEWGKPYIIDTRDGAVLKRLYEADADRLRLVSDNKAYPPIELERSEVIAAYRVISHLRPVV